jgi:hypothetical protein
MSYDALGAGALDYSPCRYGTSKLLFRGPSRRLDAPYVAFLGGTATYGKFLKAPFPALIESDLGINCINFGVPNAGVDVLNNDPFVTETTKTALVTVLQVVGAQNMTNRYYSVHPRRNDRFLTASSLLTAMYPDVDFAEFHFTRHMLSRLFAVSRERFAVVREELQSAWVTRMQLLLSKLESRVVLVWFSASAPSDANTIEQDPAIDRGPLFVTRELLYSLKPHVAQMVELVASKQAIEANTKGMIFSEMEALAAREMLGPKAHGELALVLGKVLQKLV